MKQLTGSGGDSLHSNLISFCFIPIPQIRNLSFHSKDKYKKYYNCIFSIECNLRKHGAVTNQTTWNSIQRHWISLIVWFGWPAVWRRRSELIDGGSSCSAINQWTPAGAPHNSLWELLAAQLPFHLLNCCARLHSVHSASCFSFILFITPSQPAQSPRQAGLH